MKRLQISPEKNKKLSVVLFLLEDEVSALRPELESIADHPGIHLTAQPCPFEGIEFLYRVPFEIEGQAISVDKSLYWHLLSISNKATDRDFQEFCNAHYALLVNLLEQDSKKVEQEKNKLQALLKKYSL